MRARSVHLPVKPGEPLSGFLTSGTGNRILAAIAMLSRSAGVPPVFLRLGNQTLAALAMLLLAATPCHAAPRSWRSADGERSFAGEYVSHDLRRVTVRRGNGRVISLDIERLHADDKAWLATQTVAGPAAQDPVAPDDSAVFDTLHLGDSYPDVTRKLDESALVELTVDHTFLGRLGINGTYRTRQQVGGQHCLLFFDWTDGDPLRMRELSLQTEPRDGNQYSSKLQSTWKAFAELLAMLHGPPVQTNVFPKITDLDTDGMFLASHLWRLENGHSALLGSARDLGRFSVVVRFTTDKIEPIKIPAPAR